MNEKHGMTYSSEYQIWENMIQRCCNPKAPNYHRYGGRGIAICERWRNSFSAFFADMGPRPSKNHSVDRKNNDGNYEPGNCRWATRKEQSANSSTAQIIEFNGELMTISECARRQPIRASTIRSRIKAGWGAFATKIPAIKHKRLKPSEIAIAKGMIAAGLKDGWIAEFFGVNRCTVKFWRTGATCSHIVPVAPEHLNELARRYSEEAKNEQ